MRSVRSATWTSVRPVSWASPPYWVISSCLRSWVRVMRPVRVAGRSPFAQLAGPLDVGAHLDDELVHGVEALLPAQPRQEVQPQRASVEVDVLVDQIGLHQHRVALAERRADPDR